MNTSNLLDTAINRDTFCKTFVPKQALTSITYVHSHEYIEEPIGRCLYLYGYDFVDVCIDDLQGQKYIVLSYDPHQANNGKGAQALTAKEVFARINVIQDNLPVVLQNNETGEYEPVINWASDRTEYFLFGLRSPKV